MGNCTMQILVCAKLASIRSVEWMSMQDPMVNVHIKICYSHMRKMFNGFDKLNEVDNSINSIENMLSLLTSF